MVARHPTGGSATAPVTVMVRLLITLTVILGQSVGMIVRIQLIFLEQSTLTMEITPWVVRLVMALLTMYELSWMGVLTPTLLPVAEWMVVIRSPGSATLGIRT